MQVSIEIKPNTEVFNLTSGIRFVIYVPMTITAWLQTESQGIITFIYRDQTCEINSDRVKYEVL